MNAFILATCQGGMIQNALNESPEFRSTYDTYHVRNYEYIFGSVPFVDDPKLLAALTEADLFIYQPLASKYGNNSTDFLTTLVKPECIKIAVPYVVMRSLMPVVIARKADTTDDWDNGYDTIEETGPIDRLVEEGLSRREILQLFDEDRIDWEFNRRYEQDMKYLRMKESISSIRVCDYIEDNLQRSRLFTYFSHPTTNLLVHIVNQILSMLGFSHIHDHPDDLHFNPGDRGTADCYKFPTCSVRHYGFRFVGDIERMAADRYYREIIQSYIP